MAAARAGSAAAPDCRGRGLQVGVDYYKQFNFIRYWATRRMTAPLGDLEALMCSAAAMAVLYNEDTSPHARRKRLRNAACIVCLSESGAPARLIAKYRPPAMVFTASTNAQTVRQVRGGRLSRVLVSGCYRSLL